MPKPLSARAIEIMRPGDKKADAGEYTGLRVHCGSKGTKSFVYRFKSPETDKLTQIKIGRYPQTTLADARVQLAALKALRATGICPKAEQIRVKAEDERQQQEAAAEKKTKLFTVEAMVERYLSEYIEDRFVEDSRHVGGKRRIPGARELKGQRETRRTLYGDAVRVLGPLPAASVTRKQVIDLILDIVRRGANVQAGSVLRELTSAYDYAIGLGLFDTEFPNPGILAKAGLKQARVRLTSEKGRRVLSDTELSAVLRWLPGSGFSTTQKNVLRFSLWTGCRTGEVCAAEWADIDLDRAVWHLRESKNGAERYVQLSVQAVRFLHNLKLTTDLYPFPSTRTKKPIQQKSLSETKWRLKSNPDSQYGRGYQPHQLWLNSMEDWSPHDLRRTVRTGLSRLQCPSEVAEAILGHSRKGIEGTYDLHKYESECRHWLQKWADHLDNLLLREIQDGPGCRQACVEVET